MCLFVYQASLLILTGPHGTCRWEWRPRIPWDNCKYAFFIIGQTAIWHMSFFRLLPHNEFVFQFVWDTLTLCIKVFSTEFIDHSFEIYFISSSGYYWTSWWCWSSREKRRKCMLLASIFWFAEIYFFKKHCKCLNMFYIILFYWKGEAGPNGRGGKPGPDGQPVKYLVNNNLLFSIQRLTIRKYNLSTSSGCHCQQYPLIPYLSNFKRHCFLQISHENNKIGNL